MVKLPTALMILFFGIGISISRTRGECGLAEEWVRQGGGGGGEALGQGDVADGQRCLSEGRESSRQLNTIGQLVSASLCYFSNQSPNVQDPGSRSTHQTDLHTRYNSHGPPSHPCLQCST